LVCMAISLAGCGPTAAYRLRAAQPGWVAQVSEKMETSVVCSGFASQI